MAGLNEKAQDAIDRSVHILESIGSSLGRPQVDAVKGSRHPQMKELRIQVGGAPHRIFFAFDPRRVAILLIGGCKQGNQRFYNQMVPVADALYDTHLKALKKEGLP